MRRGPGMPQDFREVKMRHLNEKALKRLEIILFIAGAMLLLIACAAGGPVVTVTELGDSSKALRNIDLKKGDKAKLEELKKTIIATPRDPGAAALTDILEKSPSYTVAEYLEKYPEGKDTTSDYKIGGYDVLSIQVYEEKDLSRESVRVTADGYITFPLIGRLKVAEKTTSEIEKLIAKELAAKDYLLDAHVSVMVAKYEGRKFSVLGAVTSPGLYPLQAQERVLDGISKAGGIAIARSTDAKQQEAQAQEGMVIRTLHPGKDDEKKIAITFDLQGLLKGKDQQANILLMEKDVVYIPSADYFYIIGEVKTPGSYAFNKKDITIAEAVSMAGGFTRIAARNSTRIVRVEKGVEKIYKVNMDAITKSGKMTQAVYIRPNDLIVVPESFF